MVSPRLAHAPSDAKGIVTGVLRTVTGGPVAGLCLAASGSAGDAVATTGADGRYLFSGLRQGRYSLAVSTCPGRTGALPLGTVFSSLPSSVVVTGHRVLTVPTSTALRLGADGSIDGQRANTGTPTAQSASATKRGSISGLVTGGGKKLAKICVGAVGVSHGQVRVAITGKSGKYQISHLRPDRYVVIFLAGPRQCPNPDNWLDQFYPNETTVFPNKLTTVTVKAGKNTPGIDAKLKQGGQITGAVRGQGGKPAAAICVTLFGDSHNTRFTEIRIKTGKAGGYVTHGVAPGAYLALFSTGCGNRSNLAAQWWRGASTLKGATKISVARRQHVAGVDANLRRGAIVTGVVRAKTAKRTPIPGICVLAFDNGPIAFRSTAIARKNGRFTVKGLSTGSYTFNFDPTCASAHRANFLRFKVTRSITAGRTIKGLTALMRPAAGLSGRVTGTRGTGLRGICVTVLDETEETAVTRPDGSYSLDQVPPGQHRVNFIGGCGNKGSVAPQFYKNQAAGQGATLVTFTGGQFTRGIDATMQPGGTVAGLVTDSAGHPLSAICAGAAPVGDFDDIGGFPDQVQTDHAGRYRIANLIPGAYQVSIGCLTGKFSTQWFPDKPDSAQARASVKPSAVTTINARLTLAGKITGTVTDRSGKAVRNECVELTDPATGEPIDSNLGDNTAFTNRHGDYRFTGITPDRYWVQFANCEDQDRFAQQWYRGKVLERSAAPVIVRPGGTTGGINARLAPAARISGLVTSDSGKPLRFVCVIALSFAAGDFEEGQTNAAAPTRSPGSPRRGTRSASSPAGIREWGPRPSTSPPRPGRCARPPRSSCQAGGAISGFAYAGQPGTPAPPGTCVIAIPVKLLKDPSAAFESSGLAQSNADGHYTISGLAPGAYKVFFNDADCSYFLNEDEDTFNNEVASPVAFGSVWFNGQPTEGTATEVTVTAGKTKASVNAVAPDFGGITGSVTTPTHAAIPGECVTAVPQATGHDPFFAIPPIPETAITGPEGNYSLIDVQPGRYKVEFSSGCGATGHPTKWWDGVSSASKATVITIKPSTVTSGISATFHS